MSTSYDRTDTQLRQRAAHGPTRTPPAPSTASFLRPAALSFRPVTSFTRRDGAVQRFNVFGIAGVVGGFSLREFSFGDDGSGFEFTDHPLPSGDRDVMIGPCGSLWTSPGAAGHGYAFITTRYDRSLSSRVWARHWDPARGAWGWESLGAPADVRIAQAPVATQYLVNGRMRLAVLVLGEGPDGAQRVYGRYTDDHRSWSDWASFGVSNEPAL